MKQTLLLLLGLTTLSFASLAHTTNKDPNSIETLLDSVVIAKDLQYYRQILPLAKKALAAYEETEGDRESEMLAAIYNAMSMGYYEQDDLDSCHYYVDKAVAMLTSLGLKDSPVLAGSYTMFGEYYAQKAESDKTQQYLEKALSINLLNFGETHIQTLKNYEQIALLVHHRKLELEKALALAKKVEKGYLRYFGPDHVQMIHVNTLIGMIHREGQEYDKALYYFNRAIAIAKKTAFNNTSSYLVYGQIGELYKRMQKFKKAEQAYTRAMEIMHSVDDKPNDNSFALLYARVMVLYYLHENFDKGDTHFYKALQALKYSPEEPAAFSQIRNVLILNFLFRARLTIYQGHYDKSKAPHLLDTIADVSQRVLLLDDYLFNKATGATNEFVDNYTFYIYEQIIKNLFQQGRGNNNQAFLMAEKAKYRLLFENAQLAKADKFAGISDEIKEKERSLNLQITTVEKRLFAEQHLVANPDADKIRTYQDELFGLKRNKEQFLAELKENALNYYQLRYDNHLMSVEDVQGHLKPDEALIEYFLGGDRMVDELRSLSIYVFVVKKDTFFTEEIILDFPLEERIQQMRESIYTYYIDVAKPDSLFAQENECFRLVSTELYQQLFAPFAEHLPEKLLIIPDGPLNLIPFDALIAEAATDPNDLQGHQYLLQKHIISYGYSATSHWQKPSGKSKRSGGFIGAFAPSFEAKKDTLFPIASIDMLKNSLTTLKHNEEEVRRILSIAPGDAYLGQDASKEAFINKANDYRILHLATHGKANGKMGDFSYIAFTSVGSSLLEDERLYVRELYNLDLNADLVVLSACETGLGVLQRGDAVISISRGFDYAGAKSTLTTLWSIYDHPSTVDFMESFYKKLQSGLPKDEALRAVKLETLANSSTSAPYFWAAFIPFGDMSAIDLPSTNLLERNWMYLLALLLVLGWFFLRKLPRRSPG